jgi:adenylosuccinate lyase
MQIDVYDLVSPLDYRYYGTNRKVFEALSPYLSERAYINYQLRVESALTATLAKRGICSRRVAEEVERACRLVTPDEVEKEERATKHNIRALVNCIRRRLSDAAKPYVHLAATSADILDTATALRYKDAAQKALIPILVELEEGLIDLARREKATVQIGRTHGQHAVPITFGFAIASYVSRLGGRIEEIDNTGRNLRGKMAGAVGAYNASSLFFPDPEGFEEEVLGQLGLKPSPSSTQLVEAEFIADFFHSLVSCFGVLANFADDMRHLQRTEISEVAESFEEGQVGSSTMPHKRNPLNFENVKSLYKEFMPRMTTVYLDQISEHQRDLTNSASGRFATEIIVALYASAERLARLCPKLVVDKESIERNFQSSQETIIAEPLYILLAAAGHPDAHEKVRKLTLEAERSGKTLRELVAQDAELAPYLERMTPEQRQILSNPRLYIGRAVEKTEKICRYWEMRLENLVK